MAEKEVVLTEEQIRVKAERDRLMAVKVALVETSRTRGWAYIKQITNNIVFSNLQHSLAVEDEEESNQYRIKARVAREIFSQLFAVIDTSMNFGTESEPEWFSQLDAFAVTGGADVTEENRG